MATKISPAWLILAAALAVPGALFYNWRSHLNTQSKAELEKRVRGRMPEGAPIFGQAPGQEKLSNPISAAAPASAATVAAAPAAAAADASPNPAAAPTPSAATVEAPAAVAEIALPRDPMLSPLDKVRLAEAEALQERARHEVEQQAGRKERTTASRLPEKSGRERVDLQGIVSNGEGDKAIINGETFSEGDKVAGVTIVKITQSGVVFSFHNKRFIKSISK